MRMMSEERAEKIDIGAGQGAGSGKWYRDRKSGIRDQDIKIPLSMF